VESSPKVDKSITFYYRTVICDVLRHTDVIFFLKTTQIVSGFLRFEFFKSWQICDFQWTSKSQKCFSFGGFALLAPWPRALPLDSTGGSAPDPLL